MLSTCSATANDSALATASESSINYCHRAGPGLSPATTKCWHVIRESFASNEPCQPQPEPWPCQSKPWPFPRRTPPAWVISARFQSLRHRHEEISPSPWITRVFSNNPWKYGTETSAQCCPETAHRGAASHKLQHSGSIFPKNMFSSRIRPLPRARIQPTWMIP